MEHKAKKNNEEVLRDIRSKLKTKRGYGSRIANKLEVTQKEVYDVSWGRNKDPKILAALIEEALECEKEGDPYNQLLNQYFSRSTLESEAVTADALSI